MFDAIVGVARPPLPLPSTPEISCEARAAGRPSASSLRSAHGWCELCVWAALRIGLKLWTRVRKSGTVRRCAGRVACRRVVEGLGLVVCHAVQRQRCHADEQMATRCDARSRSAVRELFAVAPRDRPARHAAPPRASPPRRRAGARAAAAGAPAV